jgi:hypothetical protein
MFAIHPETSQAVIENKSCLFRSPKRPSPSEQNESQDVASYQMRYLVFFGKIRDGCTL